MTGGEPVKSPGMSGKKHTVKDHEQVAFELCLSTHSYTGARFAGSRRLAAGERASCPGQDGGDVRRRA